MANLRAKADLLAKQKLKSKPRPKKKKPTKPIKGRGPSKRPVIKNIRQRLALDKTGRTEKERELRNRRMKILTTIDNRIVDEKVKAALKRRKHP